MANETRQVSIFINGKEVENTIKAIAAEKRKLNNEVNKLVIGTDEYKAGVKELGRLDGVIAEHRKGVKGIEGAWDKNESSVKSFVAAAAGVFVVDRIVSYGAELGKLAVAAAVNAEQVHIAFETMLGSKAKADQLQAELFELAAKTPFELPQVQEASKKLLAFGFTAKEVVPNLTALGNIAAGVGQDKLPQLILAFGQVKAATKLTGNELRQFTEAGVPLLDALALGFKKPVSEIQKMVTDGKVGFAAVQKALFDLTSEGGRFANLMEKQSKSLGGVYSTFKDSFTQNVLLPIGEGISKVAKPALLGLTDLTESIGGVSTKADVLRNSLEKERTTISSLVNRITDQNTSNETRKKLIGQLQQEYPSFLGNLKAETATNAQLRDRLQEVNKGYLQKIIAVEASKGVEIALKQEQKGIENVAAAEVRRSELLGKAQDLVGNKTLNYAQAIDKLRQKKEQLGTFDILQRDNINDLIFKLTNAQESNQPVLDMYSKAVTAAQEKQKHIIDNIAKQNPALAKEINELLNPKIEKNTEGGIAEVIDPEKVKKRAADIEKELERFKEKIIGFRNDVEQADEDGFSKSVLRVKEKYDKEIAEIEKFKKEYPEKVGEANRLEVQIRDLSQKEVLALFQKHLSDLEAEAVKYDESALNRLRSKEDKEISAIEQKYTKILKETIALEENTAVGTEAERQKAHELRLRLEADKALEIANLKAKYRAEEAAKDAEETAKFWADMKALNDGFQSLMNEKIAKLPQSGGDEDASAVVQNIEQRAAAEKVALNKKFDEQIRLEGDATDRIAQLNEKRGQLLLGITKKTNNEIEKAERDSIAKRQAAYAALGKAIGDGVVALGDLIAGENVKNSGIQKTAALIKIAIDTATAISSVVTAAASTSITPIDLAVKIAAGVGVVLTNILAARNTLNAAPTYQKADGGYAKVIGNQDGQTYNAKVDAEFGGGLTASPTLLVGERGTEYVVPNYLLKNPMVANFTRIIEGMRLNRGVSTIQRETGGYAATSTLPSVVPTAQAVLAQDKSTEILEKIYDALLSGRIIALVDTEGALKIDALIDRGKAIRGY